MGQTPGANIGGPQPDLTINNVQVREQPVFSPTGAIGRQTVVSFFVGSHGPFTLTYSPAQFSEEKVRADMDHQVVVLRRLLTGM
ncbi:MAG: hypothetical protein ACRD4Q_01730 [Candidatus Acidiferrales bacterium]